MLQHPAERPFTATELQLGEVTDSCEDVMTGRLHSVEECHHSDVCKDIRVMTALKTTSLLNATTAVPTYNHYG